MIRRSKVQGSAGKPATKTGRALLLAAVALGGLTALLTMLWLNGQESARPAATGSSSTAAAQTEAVVVARESIPAGTRLKASMLEVKRLPAAAVAPHTVDRAELAVGKIVRYPVEAGEQLLASKLVAVAAEPGTGLAFSVPEGMRAVSVPFSEVMGAGGMVVPGDRVDVLVVTKDPSTNNERSMVVTLLQNALVLAIGQKHTPPADDGRDPSTLRTKDFQLQPKAESVTLAVTPQQTQQLFLASNEGKLGLALRSYGDEAQVVLGSDNLIRAAVAR